MMVSSRARYDTELLKDVQQVSETNWFQPWHRPQQSSVTPYRHVPSGRKSCYPQGTPLTKQARRVRGTKDLSEQWDVHAMVSQKRGVWRCFEGCESFCTEEYPVAKARNDMQPIKSREMERLRLARASIERWGEFGQR